MLRPRRYGTIFEIYDSVNKTGKFPLNFSSTITLVYVTKFALYNRTIVSSVTFHIVFV